MIPIIYAGNSGIFDGILISVLSVIENTSSPVDIYLFTMDLTEQDERFKPLSEKQAKYLDSICKAKNCLSSVRLIDVKDMYTSSLLNSPNATTSYTPYTLLRLFADRIESLPDKVIYLDADTIVAKDINELYSIDISDYELAGALDYYGKWFLGARYINAGVLLLNLDNIRKSGLFPKCIKLLNAKKVFLPDQTALNRLANTKLIIDTKFNEQKHFRDETVIQHFAKTIIWLPYFHTRNIKPWHTDKVKAELTHKYDYILDAYEKCKEDYIKEFSNEK